MLSLALEERLEKGVTSVLKWYPLGVKLSSSHAQISLLYFRGLQIQIFPRASRTFSHGSCAPQPPGKVMLPGSFHNQAVINTNINIELWAHQ